MVQEISKDFYHLLTFFVFDFDLIYFDFLEFFDILLVCIFDDPLVLFLIPLLYLAPSFIVSTIVPVFLSCFSAELFFDP